MNALEDRIASISDWLSNVPELRYLLEDENIHKLCAVLQHYGVPTNYVDFTSEPAIAGFFAANDPNATPPGHGCIIGSTRTTSSGFCGPLPSTDAYQNTPHPEKVVVSVCYFLVTFPRHI